MTAGVLQAGNEIGISNTVVTPPLIAAAVSLPKSPRSG
jgi:hypothetical protein